MNGYGCLAILGVCLVLIVLFIQIGLSDRNADRLRYENGYCETSVPNINTVLWVHCKD